VKEQEVVDAVSAAHAGGCSLEVRGSGSLLGRLPTPAVRDSITELGLDALLGVVDYRPADLVVVVRPGTTLDELAEVLGAKGQECPIAPVVGQGATVGGVVASGLAGLRRLRVGPVRDWLLGARFVTGDGRLAAVGGATIKNVSGYDLPRLLCGSWGTLGVLVELTLRVRPRPACSVWYRTEAPIDHWLGRLYRPASVMALPGETRVLLEGHPKDCAEQAALAGLDESTPPRPPTGARLAVPPSQLRGLLGSLGRSFAAEWGVGVVHLDGPWARLVELRQWAEDLGGRLLVFDAPPGIHPFGMRPCPDYNDRLKAEMDPRGILAPWRFAA
jgi:hypothetical protein